MRIESWLENCRKRGRSWIEPPLALLAILYGILVQVRHWLYDQGLLSIAKSPLLTVSVGNITVGGSGKTPLVAMLTKLLMKDCKVAIATRGYRGTAEKERHSLIVKNEGGELLGWQRIGDEPYWLANTLKQASVIVGRRRHRSAQIAWAKGCQLLILDDGMQHRKLRRDIEVVVVEGRDPFGGGFFLPKGRLREDPKRLLRADLVVVNGAITEENRKQIFSLTRAPIVQGEMQVTQVRDRKGQKVVIQGTKVAIFCAIGSPQRFVEQLTAYGSEVVATYFLPDHRPFQAEGLQTFAKEASARGAHYLCCTEKDEVKLPQIEELRGRIAVVEGEFVIKKNEESFRQIVEQIKTLAKEKQ